MSLKEQLTADMKEAMKNKEKDRLAVIRMVRGAIRQQEIDDIAAAFSCHDTWE